MLAKKKCEMHSFYWFVLVFILTYVLQIASCEFLFLLACYDSYMLAWVLMCAL